MEATPETEATIEEVTEETTSITEENVLEHIGSKLDSLDDKRYLPVEESEVEEEETLALPEAEGEEDPIEEPEEELFEVVLPGGEKARVTYNELVRSYSQEADYTRKSEKNAAVLKEMEVESQRLVDARSKYGEKLNLVISEKEASLKRSELVNWEQLYEDDPDHYHKLKRAEEATEKSVAKDKADKATLDAELANEHQNQYATHLQAQHTELIKRRPAFGDEKTYQAEWQKVNKELHSRGFSAEEAQAMTDARAIDIVMDAIAWKELQEKKPQVVKKSRKAPKFQKPGSPVEQTKVNAAQQKADLAAAKRGDMPMKDYIRKYKIK